MWSVMNDGMMNGEMNWGMGIIGALIVVLLVLSVMALATYIFTR